MKPKPHEACKVCEVCKTICVECASRYKAALEEIAEDELHIEFCCGPDDKDCPVEVAIAALRNPLT